MKLNLTHAQLTDLLGAAHIGAPTTALVQEVIFDSRKISRSEGVAFFGLNGPKRSGFDFVAPAYAKGIRIFVLDQQPAEVYPDATYYIVEEVLAALQQLAAFHRKRINYPIVAIAGAIGKTTVKEWIYHLLAGQSKVQRSPKSYNSQLGVALSILQLPLEGDLALIEAAVSKPGEMEKLHAMIKPNFVVFTTRNAGFRHEFGSDAAYSQALDRLTIDCEWVLDGDQPAELSTESAKALFENIPFKDPVRLHNAKLAIACALRFGPCTSKDVAELPKLANRLETFEGINDATLINDAYTLDLLAFEGSFAFLKSVAKGKSSMVCCLLAENQAHLKEEIIGLLLANHIDNYFIWTTLPAVLPDISNQVVLIKGNQHLLTEALLAKWKRKSHSTVVRYDLSALQHNLRHYQQSLAPTTQILAMVKAQAYGAGLDQIAKQLLAGGVNYFGVAYADEGVLLRQAGIKLPILVMNAEPAGFESCIEYKLEPAIYSPAHLDAFIRTLIAAQIQDYPIHLKFDTGMHRLGFLPEQTDQLLQTLRAQPEVCVKSVYSHMACADEPQHPMNDEQIKSFKAICSKLESALPYAFLKHLLNSEGAAHFPQAQFDMVRLGIGLFGVNHDPQFELQLKPVISWASQISQLKHLKKGACVGYGCSEILEDDSQIAVVPVGYADGFKRNLSNGVGGVYIDGNFCPTIGRVCMDMIMVLAPQARLDAEVEIIGTQQTLSSFAEKAQTIPYEILTSISPRVQRTYVND
ncbi:MAG: alanine racemase [Crocinitomicaceae bacterium]|nr:alanine racemase [Crocinitomicaceae bacterium]